MGKTPIQKLINGKPSEFARRIGCPKSTANHYSDGTRTPPKWVYKLIKDKVNKNTTIEMFTALGLPKPKALELSKKITKLDNDLDSFKNFDTYVCEQCKGNGCEKCMFIGKIKMREMKK